jgi:phosphatidylserine decarboxylase
MDKMKEKMLLSALKVLPKNQISWVFGQLASIKFPKPMNQLLIKKFADHYKINLRELEKPISDYKSLNQFFTRKLRKNARPIDTSKDVITSPADGEVSQFGAIENGKLLQVKGKYFTLDSFLKDTEKSKLFNNGSFMTIYLSPQDYHRVHTPFHGELTSINYIKGKLFPVNKISTHSINELFSTNERVVFYLNDKKLGNYAVVMVGATNVGSISLSFDDFKTNKLIQKSKTIEVTNLEFKKADELGVFNLGSTVVLLFENNKINFSDIKLNSKVKLGESIAKIIK